MGLGAMDLLDEDDGGKAVAAAAVSCSICLEVVTDNGDRSWAKLQCGHQFHLDCIGSAFNVKGTMQCPNCRKIEKGQWLYGNGTRPLSELNMDDWAHDEDLHDISYSEMSFGVHWCPFSALTGFPSSFDEGEFQSSAYHDLPGHHAIIAEHTPVSSTSHPCPYIYVGEIRPSSSASTPSISDGSSFNNHWSGPVASEVPHSYGFPSADVQYHNWDHSSPFAANSRIPGSDQPSFPSMTQRTFRNSSDMPVAGVHPHILSHSSVSRAPSSVTSSAVPPYPGIANRPHDHAPSLQMYIQQSTNSEATHTPLINSGRSSSSRRGVNQVSSTDQSGGFYYSSNSSPGRTYQEGEVPGREHWFHGWEQEHQHPTFPLSQTDRDPIWGTFHPPAGGSDTGIRSSSSRRRHGSGRLPSQNRS